MTDSEDRRQTVGASVGASLIVEERARHAALGYTPERDRGHRAGTLAMAAACYASAGASKQIYVREEYATHTTYSDPWPWVATVDARPREGGRVSVDDLSDEAKIRMLVKAGALIAAEIDRLLRESGG